MRLVKSDSEEEIVIERIHHVKRYSLVLCKKACKGCGICAIVCPKEAIEMLKAPKAFGQKAKPPVVDLSEKKCIYCGICEAICPFGALRIKIDGEHVVPVLRTESFAKIIRRVDVDTTKCEVGCSDCEKECPLDIIRTRRVSPIERAREIVRARKDGSAKPRALVDVQIDKCAGCRLCEFACRQGAIITQKIFHGKININPEKCPEGCTDCLDVCPFSSVLYLDSDGKVRVNERSCTYCGVCDAVCSTEGALAFERTYVHHAPIRSGAWNRALEKLTTTHSLAKELKTKGQTKAVDTVRKRFTSGSSHES
jgi:4Fe-4S ferredoxin